MIGIELGAPSSRVARLNWRLIHMASEGLFPQLIVIPLHRDHGVITMAAGKNDVIKLLPPLTLSETEARSFLDALDAVLADCHGAASKNWAVVRDIATATLRRRAPHERRREPTSAVSRQPGRSVARRRLPGHRRDRVHRRAPRQRLVARGLRGALPRARQQRHLAARASSTSRSPSATSRARDSLARAAEGCRYVFHCGALVSDWATTRGDRGDQRRGHAQPARRLASARRCGASSTSAPPTSTATRRRCDRRDLHRARAFATGTRRRSSHAEAEVRRAERRTALDTVILRPATVYGPGSTRRRRRDRARDPRRQHAAGRPRPRGRRALLRREPHRRGGARARATTPRPARRSTSATASTSPGGSSPTASPTASAARRCAGACPTGWPTASASRSSTATGCCAGPRA